MRPPDRRSKSHGNRGRPGQARPHGADPDEVWLFGIHAVRDALENPARERRRLILTLNARERLGDAVEAGGLEPEIADPRRFPAPLDPQSVHQGAAMLVAPLAWPGLGEFASRREGGTPLIVALDRVTDPHNVGAILRSAEVFGADAVIAPRHHSAPEGGALAKSASGALERQPYLRVRNLADALIELSAAGFTVIGLAGESEIPLDTALAEAEGPLCLVLGAEGPGLRPRTRDNCHRIARIPSSGAFGSLNVSNAAAVALYAATLARKTGD